MEVLGRDPKQEAYRIAITLDGARLVGLVPEHVMGGKGLPLTGGHGHGMAYDWLARHQNELVKTLKTLATGARVAKRPFDAVVLAEE